MQSILGFPTAELHHGCWGLSCLSRVVKVDLAGKVTLQEILKRGKEVCGGHMGTWVTGGRQCRGVLNGVDTWGQRVLGGRQGRGPETDICG